jgi:hypothetical protein
LMATPAMPSRPPFMLFLNCFNNGMSVSNISLRRGRRIASDRCSHWYLVSSDGWLGFLVLSHRRSQDLPIIALLESSKSNNVHNQTGCEDQTNYKDPFSFRHFAHSFVSMLRALLSVRNR